MELTQRFEAAVAASKLLTERPSNDTLLQLYALYKQATEGDNHNEPPSNPFDIVAKAKHEAWHHLKGTATADAMQRYVTLIESLQ